MKTYKLFTGEACSPCKLLKERIDALGLQASFSFLDVADNTAEAMQNRVRGIPHIVSSDGAHYIGLSDGLKLIESLR